MTSSAPKIVWERSDQLLTGAVLSVRGVGLPEGDELRSAVAVTLQLDGTSCQVSEDGTVRATVLLAPDEAFGVSRWFREAAQSVADVGPPLLTWDGADEPPAE